MAYDCAFLYFSQNLEDIKCVLQGYLILSYLSVKKQANLLSFLYRLENHRRIKYFSPDVNTDLLKYLGSNPVTKYIFTVFDMQHYFSRAMQHPICGDRACYRNQMMNTFSKNAFQTCDDYKPVFLQKKGYKNDSHIALLNRGK
ncbi:hypothetical protein EGR_07441 [Echinococcus granulosus]|uniref:Uncharacterized protein n=1 Tax=Echinococcus granulosus TaxID=6210 RepID=W6U9L5_ECHGR|nr:hypothetical protein EGR_07441 [Echinococcus granulosus]EUB57700.1 hypothetical protein EGR_07441 [Echinococcus granulosus]